MTPIETCPPDAVLAQPVDESREAKPGWTLGRLCDRMEYSVAKLREARAAGDEKAGEFWRGYNRAVCWAMTDGFGHPFHFNQEP